MTRLGIPMKVNINNDGLHIAKILNSTTCKKHQAKEGQACWYIRIVLTKDLAPAVCGARIRRAGYTGQPSPSSLSQKTTYGRRDSKFRSK